MAQTTYSLPPETTEQNAKGNKRSYIISQVLAAAVGSLLTMNVSSMNAITTIVNGAIMVKNGTRPDANERFTITDSEASIYTTVLTITNLISSIASGIHQDVFGRRNCILISTFPQILSWFFLYFAENEYWLYLHAAAVGIGSAYCEHVVVTYVSEISSVEMRGRLFSVGKFGYGIGALLTFMLGNFFHWRKLALIFSTLPLILPFYLYWLPESPLWLLSKERDKQCRKSLMWLRGWTSMENIEPEYQNILTQLKQRKTEAEENDKYIMTNYIKLFTRREVLEPFKLSLVLLLSSFLLSLRPIKFFFINFLHTLGVRADKMKVMTLNGFAGIFGCVLLIITIKKCGKRALVLLTFSMSAFCVLLLAIYSNLYSEYNFNSIGFVFVLSTVIHCLGGYTLAGMPWFIISEIFPQKYRGFCSGITGMVGHFMISALTGTYLKVEKMIGTTNVLYLYCFIGVISIFYLYKYLPETENKSLHDIEEYFKGNRNPAREDTCQNVCVKLCPTEAVSSKSDSDNIIQTN